MKNRSHHPGKCEPLDPVGAEVYCGNEHVAAFAFLGFAFCAAYRDRMTLVCSLVLGSAVVLELLQKLTPDRHARLLDASEEVVGGLLGILLASIALRLIERWTAASDV